MNEEVTPYLLSYGQNEKVLPYGTNFKTKSARLTSDAVTSISRKGADDSLKEQKHVRFFSPMSDSFDRKMGMLHPVAPPNAPCPVLAFCQIMSGA